MNRNTLVLLISLLFILLFTYAAVSKLLDYPRFIKQLSRPAEFGSLGTTVGLLVIGSELAIAALLAFPRTRHGGLVASTILMILFTGFITYILFFSPTIPCTCGGVLQQMTWTEHLVFNGIFIALGAIGIIAANRSVRYWQPTQTR